MLTSQDTKFLTNCANFKIKYYGSGYSGNMASLCMETAQTIAEEEFRYKISFTKLRQYYNEVNTLYHATNDHSPDEVLDQEVRMRLNLIIAKAKFDSQRNDKTVPGVFVGFLIVNNECIKNYRDLECFKRHYEAIVAYAKGVLNNNRPTA